jgi:hypothetical protein
VFAVVVIVDYVVVVVDVVLVAVDAVLVAVVVVVVVDVNGCLSLSCGFYMHALSYKSQWWRACPCCCHSYACCGV